VVLQLLALKIKLVKSGVDVNRLTRGKELGIFYWEMKLVQFGGLSFKVQPPAGKIYYREF